MMRAALLRYGRGHFLCHSEHLFFNAVPHLGPSYIAIMFTLSPVITLMLSIVLGVHRSNLLGVAGIAVGFVGAAMWQ